MGDPGVDVVADHFDAFFAAQHLVLLDLGQFAVAFGGGLELARVQPLADAAAGADVAGEFFLVCHVFNPPLRRRR